MVMETKLPSGVGALPGFAVREGRRPPGFDPTRYPRVGDFTCPPHPPACAWSASASSPPAPPHRPDRGSPPAPASSTTTTTFAQGGAPAALVAASSSTALIADDGPPISLTASDGTGLDAGRARRPTPWSSGPLAFTELHLTFENPRDRVTRGPLPHHPARRARRSVAFAMKIGDALARRPRWSSTRRRAAPTRTSSTAGRTRRCSRRRPATSSGPRVPDPGEAAQGADRRLLARARDADAPYVLPLRGLPLIGEVDGARAVATARPRVPLRWYEMTLAEQRLAAGSRPASPGRGTSRAHRRAGDWSRASPARAGGRARGDGPASPCSSTPARRARSASPACQRGRWR